MAIISDQAVAPFEAAASLVLQAPALQTPGAALYQQSWFAFSIPAVLALLVLFVPGMISGLALGLRGYRLYAWAPVASVFAVAASAVAAPMLGLRWGVLPVVLAAVVLAGVGFALRVVLYRSFRWPRIRDRAWGGSVVPSSAANTPAVHALADRAYGHFSHRALAAITVSTFAVTYAVAAFHCAALIHSPSAFGQTWDNAFHLNAIQSILRVGDASSLHMNVYSPGSATFYPAAWHGVVSLVVMLSGAPATVSSNAVAFAVAFMAWPAGVYCLARVATRNPLTAIIAIPLSLAFPQFPWNFLAYGTLYPNLVAYAMLPALLAFVVAGVRAWNRATVVYIYAVLVGAGALALAQPNAVIIWLLAVAAIFWGFHVRRVWNRTSGGTRIWAASGITLLWAAGVVGINTVLDAVPTLHAMRRGHMYWPAQGSVQGGLARLALLTGGWPNGEAGSIGYFSMWPLALLVVLGLVLLVVRGKQLWALGLYAGLGALFVMSYALEGRWRTYAVGWWYCDVPRLWAPLIMIFVLASAVSVGALLQWVIQLHNLSKTEQNRSLQKEEHLVQKRDQLAQKTRQPALRPMAAAVSVGLVIGLGISGPQLTPACRDIEKAYAITDSTLVDRDEQQLFLWIGQHLPRTARVAGNPMEGATFVWAVGGTQALFPKITSGLEPALAYLAGHLKEAGTNPQVCPLIRKFGVTHALDLRDRYLDGGTSYGIEHRYPGLDGVAKSGIGPVIAQFGEAKLVQITACGE